MRKCILVVMVGLTIGSPLHAEDTYEKTVICEPGSAYVADNDMLLARELHKAHMRELLTTTGVLSITNEQCRAWYRRDCGR